MLSRAAAFTLAALSSSKEMRDYDRAVERMQDCLEEQALEFPRCMAEEFAREVAMQPAYAQSMYQAQDQAWGRVAQEAGSIKLGMAAHSAHVTSPVAFVPYYEGSASGYCDCRICGSVNEALEMDKEIRKGVWYYYPPECGCRFCKPIVPPEAPGARDLPTLRDCHGEMDADW